MKECLLKTIFVLLFCYVNSSATTLPLIDQTGNLIINGNFELGTTTPTTTVYLAGSSAFDNFTQWANAGPVTTQQDNTYLMEGDYSASILGNSQDGILQYFSSWTPGNYTLSAWIYSVSGSGFLGLANGGGSGPNSQSSNTQTLNTWEFIELTGYLNGSSGGPLVYAYDNNSEIYVDGLWLNAGETNLSPFNPENGFNPVPEPATMILLGSGLLRFIGFKS